MIKTKVALSGSYFETPAVKRMLETCDYIYTTQAHRYREIANAFPNAEVKCIPNYTNAMINLIKEWHDDAVFVGFSDLIKAKNDALNFAGKIKKCSRYVYCDECALDFVFDDNLTPEGFEYECLQSNNWGMEDDRLLCEACRFLK